MILLLRSGRFANVANGSRNACALRTNAKLARRSPNQIKIDPISKVEPGRRDGRHRTALHEASQGALQEARGSATVRDVHDGPYIPCAGRTAPCGALVRVGASASLPRPVVRVLVVSHSRGCMPLWTAAATRLASA